MCETILDPSATLDPGPRPEFLDSGIRCGPARRVHRLRQTTRKETAAEARPAPMCMQLEKDSNCSYCTACEFLQVYTITSWVCQPTGVHGGRPDHAARTLHLGADSVGGSGRKRRPVRRSPSRAGPGAACDVMRQRLRPRGLGRSGRRCGLGPLRLHCHLPSWTGAPRPTTPPQLPPATAATRRLPSHRNRPARPIPSAKPPPPSGAQTRARAQRRIQRPHTRVGPRGPVRRPRSWARDAMRQRWQNKTPAPAPAPGLG